MSDAFLEHLSTIQATQASIGPDEDYAGTIEKLVNTEIKPAVHTFRKRFVRRNRG